MKPNRSLSVRWIVLACLLLICLPVFAASNENEGCAYNPDGFVSPLNNPIAKRGFDEFYNMDYDKSIHDFETLVREHPDDPYANNYLLSSVVFKELYRIGAMDAESYADDSFLDRKAKRPLDPVVQKRIHDLIARSVALSDALLQKNPNDIQALYARGVARGMRSTYMGMGEKAWLAAIRSALAARHDHDRVLQLDPYYTDAMMIVGVHNYIIGSLSWPVKIAASIVGISGSKQKGLQYLRLSARSNCPASMDAKIALALFLRREEKYPEALELVKEMTQQYPRSFLLAVEYGELLNAAGHGSEAIAQYHAMLKNYKEGKYSLPEPASAAWGLGVALRGQRRFEEAAQAFDMVGTFPNADKELVQRANLASGQMYDTLLMRDAALKRYQLVLAYNNSDTEADLARQYLKKAYKYRPQ